MPSCLHVRGGCATPAQRWNRRRALQTSKVCAAQSHKSGERSGSGISPWEGVSHTARGWCLKAQWRSMQRRHSSYHIDMGAQHRLRCGAWTSVFCSSQLFPRVCREGREFQ
mmetsp:Transcript_14224/g.49979  ORF Transcript_14224/g.49979 Transcript_14224/m.49979 type:complete len:111 (+) Transcript_14224:238-570(+)